MSNEIESNDGFASRHIGPSAEEVADMLTKVGCGSLDDLIEETIPDSIRLTRLLELPNSAGEQEALEEFRRMVGENRVFRSYLGMGYHGTITPPVIQRNILENPGWYTQYTPYQPEISQGRLEALLIFQTMIADLTGLPLANASLLDEATAAAEAMLMSRRIGGEKRCVFIVDDRCHPQTISVLQERAQAQGIDLRIVTLEKCDQFGEDLIGILIQYPDTTGAIRDHRKVISRVHDAGGQVVMVTDLLALTLITPPGELGADIAIGSSQRFGVPMGYGGPHAAFMSTQEKHARKMPGRIIGISRDAEGNPAYRMAIQTREQHIKRERATSNICTAQVLLAIMAGMYAVYHGPEGLRRIAHRVHGLTRTLVDGLRSLGYEIGNDTFFDTLKVKTTTKQAENIIRESETREINFRLFADGSLGINLDETTTEQDVTDILDCFNTNEATESPAAPSSPTKSADPPGSFGPFARTSDFLTHEVFSKYHSETEMLRYLARLQSRDLSLCTSMIPLGSCTMKLNATTEMLPVSWPELANLHPFCPPEQAAGYSAMFREFESMLGEITGLPAVSLQPNAGSQGEYAGLRVIKAYHESRGEAQRNICLIPVSAHGTNPASAIIAGFTVVTVACDDQGNIDIEDLKAKANEHADTPGTLGAFMVTYPSTHGVFETNIREVCKIIHNAGGQVYLDGANMNAQVGLCRPGDYGADVCHLNLHKTFCIPHGGGGPGMGPICAAEHLAPFLPAQEKENQKSIGSIAAAPYGSPLIIPISYLYIRMMGAAGLQRATEVAILNANYMAVRLKDHYEVIYTGERGRVAHEFIIDFRPFKQSAGIMIEDIAKRLMDYGFHAPTMSFPVPGTLMIEPTESEGKKELDRYCDALIAIREEIRAIESGSMSREDNPLKNAPHTAMMVSADEWTHPYPRSTGAFPAGAEWLKDHKFWPPVARIDQPWGDRNLFCSCHPPE